MPTTCTTMGDPLKVSEIRHANRQNRDLASCRCGETWRNSQRAGMSEQFSAELGEAMMQMQESFAQVRAMVKGYRACLEEDGFSPTKAEQMAAQLHMHLVAAAFRGSAS